MSIGERSRWAAIFARIQPDLTPKQMLALGVFGGNYMTDCRRISGKLVEHAKFSKNGHRASLNYFGVNASQPLDVWRKKAGSIPMIRVAGSNVLPYYSGRRCQDDLARLADGVQCDVMLRN